MFLIASSVVVNADAWEIKSGILISLQIEAHHTGHDLSGAEAFAPFGSLKIISENGYI